MEIFPANLKQKILFLTKYQAIQATDNQINKTYFKKNNKVYFNLGSINSYLDSDMEYDSVGYDSNVILQPFPELVSQNITKHVFSFSNGRIVSSKVNDYV
jgi:hypothetical protein